MPTAVPHNISIADLSAAGLRLRPVEAVTIARELTLRAHRGELPGIPTSSVLRFTSEGDTVCEGPVAAGHSVERAARLLESLLPGFDAPPEFRVPGALRLVVARALGTLDLPAYQTLDEFAEAIARFGAEDMSTLVRGLVRTWRATVDEADLASSSTAPAEIVTESLELTISDVRRARRATGLRLADIAQRSRIPISLLRELEWGYFINWPANNYGRTQLVRYARAAGLDVEVVMRAVWPVLEEAARTRSAQTPIVDGAIIGDTHHQSEAHRSEPEEQPTAVVAETRLARVAPGVVALDVRKKPERRPLWLAALAIPALIAIGFAPAVWQSTVNDPADVSQPVAAQRAQAPAAPATVPSATPPAAGPSAAQAAPDPAPAAPSVNGDAGSRASTAPEQSVAGNVRAEPGTTKVAAGRAALPEEDVAYSPTFASVGSAMFYHAEGGDRSAIMRADTDPTGAVLRVTSIVDDNANNFHARPSPDGSRIAFDSDREGGRAVYVADANGRNVRRVSGQGWSAVPSWSPDGRTLAFVRAEPGEKRPEDRPWNLWVTDLDSGETRRLTNYRYGQTWAAAWFPDGQRIAYSHEKRLIIRSLDGGDERVFNTPIEGRLIRTPAVSPDGRRVMFQVHKDGAWLLDVEKGAMRRVLTDATAEEFTWSPDGRRVAYHSRKAGGWGVWMMTAR